MAESSDPPLLQADSRNNLVRAAVLQARSPSGTPSSSASEAPLAPSRSPSASGAPSSSARPTGTRTPAPPPPSSSGPPAGLSEGAVAAIAVCSVVAALAGAGALFVYRWRILRWWGRGRALGRATRAREEGEQGRLYTRLQELLL